MNLLRWIRPGIAGFFVMLFVVINGSTLFPETDIMLIMAAGLVSLGVTVFALYKVLPPKKKDISVQDKEYRPNFLFSLAVGTVTIMIFSQSSPLYPFNNWVDPNCFFTVGASVLKGLVPYRDLYEQKGPLLYFIHTLAALLSRDTFFGMFVIQVICCSFVHYFAMKTAALYTSVNRTGMLCSIPLMFLSYSVLSYYFGDSAEELLFPFYSAAIYITISSIRKNKYPGIKDIILLGAGGAFAFWIKYTLCGYYLAVIIFLIVFGIRRKQYKKVLLSAIWFAVTCIAVSIPILIYFLANNALDDLFTAYFYNNIFLYGDVAEVIPLSGRIPYTLTFTIIRLGRNIYMAVMIFLSAVILMIHGKKGELPFYIGAFSVTCLFIFMGSFQGFYYPFALAVFTLPAWTCVFNLASKIKRIPVISVICLGLSIIAFLQSPSTPGLFKKKENMPQYIFSGYINSSDSPTLLNYGFLDQGFYTVAGVTPTERYFCGLNIDLVFEEAFDAKEEAIAEGRVEFIVTKNHEYAWENYELITYADWTEQDFDNESGTDRFYLYRRID